METRPCLRILTQMYTVGVKKVPVPYSFYHHITLSLVKHYEPITGANRNYSSPIYSVIAPFTWAKITSVLEAL